MTQRSGTPSSRSNPPGRSSGSGSAAEDQPGPLTARQQQVLAYIDEVVRHRGYPPSVREIGEAVGLSSSSTVHAHLAALQDKGYLRRDPSKPRAMEVTFDPGSGSTADRRPVRHVPLIGEVKVVSSMFFDLGVFFVVVAVVLMVLLSLGTRQSKLFAEDGAT